MEKIKKLAFGKAKEKKEKQPKVSKRKHGGSDTDDPLVDKGKEKSSNSQAENTNGNNDDSMHPSWKDPVLYEGSTFNSKVTPDDFERLHVIGNGSFGKVIQVKFKHDGQIYAMKVLKKEEIIRRKQVMHTRAEKSILAKLQHPFIVRLHYAFQTDTKLYMILDFINGGELFYHLKKEKRFSEARVRMYAAEIVLAVSHLHTYDIVYRDLKPENILLNYDGHIVITDFGLSKKIDPQQGTKTFCGTPEYLAPEVLKGQPHGFAVDWWSLGTLMYEMLTGLPPFYSQNFNLMYQKILTAEIKFPSYISPEGQSLLAGLLTRDPKDRLGSSHKDAREIKAHPFFKGLDWDQLYKKEIPAQFVPQVSGKSCIKNFDDHFTALPLQDSLPDHVGTDLGNAEFQNWSIGPGPNPLDEEA